MQAIGTIAFVVTGTTDPEEASNIIDRFFRKEGNRVSYQNALVLEETEADPEQRPNDFLERSREANVGPRANVVGVALMYDGSIARALDEPLEQAIAQRSGDSDYRIPTEAEPTEFYLDTVSVNPRYQGRGFGRDLIEASCDQARKLGHDRVGLLVDVGNSGAMRLYERLKFRIVGRKQIAGDEYLHMVRSTTTW